MIRALDMFRRNGIEKEAQAPQPPHGRPLLAGDGGYVGRGGRGRGEGERPGGLCGPRWTWTPGSSRPWRRRGPGLRGRALLFL